MKHRVVCWTVAVLGVSTSLPAADWPFFRGPERNGKTSETEVPGDLSVWLENVRLLLGNEAGGGRPWKGHIDRLALFSRFIEAPEAALRHAMVAK